ncbi:MAG TPA: HAMP domain-containing sensor histidine kinase, partial [Steroidobacteraceae bacterium]|nr:HAMP domain-containing sensor histidine kinase [Steroidobacteraceae bacterium]
GKPARAVLVHVQLDGGYNLLVGRGTERFTPLETHFWYGLGAAIAVLAIVGICGGILIRRAILTRVQGIQATASAIMQGDLSHRLATGHSDDELDTLARTINRMLEQIEHLINGVRNVSNAIAHDLRTPLAELRSRLEELALTKPSPAETFAELDAAVADVDRVIAIFDALLRLAQIDTGMRRKGFVPLDVAAVAAEAVEFYQPAAELKGVALQFRANGPAPTSGDPVLLAQAVSNLIDNALKYVHAGGSITVEIPRHTDQVVEIAVADNGPGIPDGEKPKVTERFYRGDASRGTPGVGLGLSLVDAVARLHGGSLRFVDNHPGLRVLLTVAPR